MAKCPLTAIFLFGPTFALLRSEFRDWRERSFSGRLDRNIENILITMGEVMQRIILFLYSR